VEEHLQQVEDHQVLQGQQIEAEVVEEMLLLEDLVLLLLDINFNKNYGTFCKNKRK
jgi:hypothetical protein